MCVCVCARARVCDSVCVCERERERQRERESMPTCVRGVGVGMHARVCVSGDEGVWVCARACVV